MSCGNSAPLATITVIILYVTKHTPVTFKEIVEGFHKKMKYKNLEFTGIDQLINPKNEHILKQNWLNSLGHQIAKDRLADYAGVIAEVQKYFEEIFSESEYQSRY
jgi:hypothetical protein